jgi:uncharacterized membrane protein YfcA
LTHNYSRFGGAPKSGCGRSFQIFILATGCPGRPDTARWSRRGAANRHREDELMVLLILALGLGAGVLVGLLGIGGGVVLVPAMVYLLHMDQHLAQGTSLFILLPPIGLGALRQYWQQGQVDFRAGILCGAGFLLGGYGGSVLAMPISSRHLQGIFGCFLMLAALLLWRKTVLDARAAVHAEAR